MSVRVSVNTATVNWSGAVWKALIVRFFFFQAEDGIRDAQESRGLGDVYKRQTLGWLLVVVGAVMAIPSWSVVTKLILALALQFLTCLLYTSDAADDLLCVDLGGRRIIQKKIKPITVHKKHSELP